MHQHKSGDQRDCTTHAEFVDPWGEDEDRRFKMAVH